MASRRLTQNAVSLAIRQLIAKPAAFYRSSHTSSNAASRDQPTEFKIEQVSVNVHLDPFLPVQEPQKEYLDDLNVPLKKSFNLAAYVNTSQCLQELIRLGVSLYDIENNNPDAARQLLTLHFERDCAPFVMFLVDNGLKERNLGRFISEYPEIFQEQIGNLQKRIDYLKSKAFSEKHIATALNRSSHIIKNNVKTLDFKLGQLQIEFMLPANILRSVVSKYPPIISIPVGQYKLIFFCLIDEFGFSRGQMHKILEAQPRIIQILRPVLQERVDLVHNRMKFSHNRITQFPKLITGPRFDIKYRFEYLEKLDRAQFNPFKPLYVPPYALYNGSDEEFCQKYAKTSIEDYKLYLKAA